MALSGDYALVGAAGGWQSSSACGSAYIFVQSGGSWTQQAKLTATDAAFGDLFGWSAAISGDHALIGADGNDDGGYDSGSSYIFVQSGGSWTQQAKLTATDGASWDLFGRSAAISGDHALIGAYGNDDGGGFASGSAYIFLTIAPTAAPTNAPSVFPTVAPTLTNAPSVFPTVAPTMTISQVVTCRLNSGASSYTANLKTVYEAAYFSEVGIMTNYSFKRGCVGNSSASDTRRSSMDITFKASANAADLSGAYSMNTAQLTNAISAASINLGFNLPAPSITSISTVKSAYQVSTVSASTSDDASPSDDNSGKLPRAASSQLH